MHLFSFSALVLNEQFSLLCCILGLHVLLNAVQYFSLVN